MAARFVLKPETLDVLVASNLFADILTDLGSAICGSIGIAPSAANINPERKYPSLFEPVHGSAPDIAGRGVANPIAAIWSGAMMLDFLGEGQAAGLVIDCHQGGHGRGQGADARPGRPRPDERGGRRDRRQVEVAGSPPVMAPIRDGWESHAKIQQYCVR